MTSFSHLKVWHLLCAVLLVALCALCIIKAPGLAYAAYSEAQKTAAEEAQDKAAAEEDPLVAQGVSAESLAWCAEGGADGSSSLSLPRLCPAAVSTSWSPSTVEVGISCGMDWMCGLDPCLCGSSDAWGSCSCNGLETVNVSCSYVSSDERVVRVIQAFDRVWLVPVGSGDVQVTATATLPHYQRGTFAIPVHVSGFTCADLALVGIVASVLVVLVGMVVFVRRVCIPAVRRRKGVSNDEGA